jgi:hypothetical protein
MSQSDTALRATGRRGYELVQRKYTWDRIVDELDAVYRWMLGGGIAPDTVQYPSRAA